jgi:hypothetical protein
MVAVETGVLGPPELVDVAIIDLLEAWGLPLWQLVKAIAIRRIPRMIPLRYAFVRRMRYALALTIFLTCRAKYPLSRYLSMSVTRRSRNWFPFHLYTCSIPPCKANSGKSITLRSLSAFEVYGLDIPPATLSPNLHLAWSDPHQRTPGRARFLQ